MTTPNGPICDNCRKPLPNGACVVSFFHPQYRYCTPSCLDMAEAQRREAALLWERPFAVAPGWVDCAGRTRTWFLVTANGDRLAEVTTKRDAMRLQKMLSERK